MKLVTYRASVEDAATLGAVVDGFVVDVARLGQSTGVDLPGTMLEFIDRGLMTQKALQRLLDAGLEALPPQVVLPLANVTLLAPIPRPRKNIFGIGLNYVEHVAESARTLNTAKDLPSEPVIFSKPTTTVIGPGDPIRHNAEVTQQMDWEVELAAIIGTTARRVSEEAALNHVFGYSVMIDVSARDCRRAGQWIVSKGQDSFAPFGPCIVTSDEVGDPHDLTLWLTVNGVEKQRSNTRHMLFKIPELIADISKGMTLEPGDIIATGTPEGVGAGRDPQEWLWPGDVVECGVDGIGQLRHSVIAV
ncbi:MAG: gentisate 1,2-dioxygenase [Pseudooceanicola sp.]|jgi:2-keto-4-pentenoate hydratase/2-oxohepta-3-ene-1,7-dioic acid hydratase in catechol pathway|nr:gentisate 1,2-dioxygenase [Pseudooceanicola sp.]